LKYSFPTPWNVRHYPFIFFVSNKKHRTQIIGADLLSFVNFHTAYPDATLDAMVISIFIFNEGGLLYSHQTIPNHDHDELGITKKMNSTEAYQAQ
jgi:hypothetical protein